MLSLSGALAPFSFQTIKTEFNVKQHALKGLNGLKVFRNSADEDVVKLSSNKMLAVLLDCLQSVKDALLKVFNDDLLMRTLNVDYELITLINTFKHSEHNIAGKTNMLQDVYDCFDAVKNNGGYTAFYTIKDHFRLLVWCCHQSKRLKRNKSLCLYVVLAYHEVFDSFLRAVNDVLMTFNDDLSVLTLFDLDMKNRNKIKQCVIPRGMNAHSLITTFILPPFDYPFTHQIQDLQQEELNNNNTLDVILINVYNDVCFYLRLLPTNWSGTYTTKQLLDNNGLNITSINRRLKTIMKAHDMI